MADDLDDLLRDAMAGLSRQAPVGYFDVLPGRVLARLDGAELDDFVTEEAVTEDEVIGEREEHSGLQDIRNLASETKARLARQSQSPSARDERLASSSAGWKVVALPDPARTSGPIAMPIGVAAATVPVPVVEPGVRSAVAASAPTAVSDRIAAPASVPATVASPPVAGRANRRRRVAIIGAGVALAAGAMIVVTRQSAAPASSAPDVIASAERPEPVERAATAPRPAPSAAPPEATGAGAAAPAGTIAPAADPSASVDAASSTRGTGRASVDVDVGKLPGPTTKAPSKLGKRGALDEPAIASKSGGGKTAAPPGSIAKPDVGKRKQPSTKGGPSAEGGTGSTKIGAPDAANQAPGSRTGGSADLAEPSFDELAKEAGVSPVKPAATKLGRTSLSADDIKRGMAAVAPRAKACFNGTEGTAAVSLTVAPSGRISKVVITGVFAGTPTAACVERAVKSTSFPPWDGGPQSVGYSYLLSE